MKRKVTIGLIVVLVIIQFIRPTRNVAEGENPNDISKRYTLSADIDVIIKESCYDCHSNHTNYPWYANIQPVGWWMQSHINEGKQHLNFSEFGSYPEKKAKHKFEEIEDAALNGWMPLGSYTLIHGDAKLTPEESKALAAWAGALK